MRNSLRVFAISLALASSAPSLAGAQTVAVGSKKFTESYVLGEIAKRILTEAGITATHTQGMGGTIILWQALKSGDIAFYPEYTGTISEEILKLKGAADRSAMESRLKAQGIGMGPELGFNNTYALVMRRSKSEAMGIASMSDLKSHPNLRVGVTPEFLGRKDGWKPLSARYGLSMKDVRGVEHALGYAALASDQIDLKECYSTDAKIKENDLVVLKDDLGYFPQYKALFLYRLDAPTAAISALAKLGGTIDEQRMTAMNADAERTKDYTLAASAYFGKVARKEAEGKSETTTQIILRTTKDHLVLVGISLGLAILAGIPLGILAWRSRAIGAIVLGLVGLVQTIPSLALLAFLIPWLGIGTNNAIVALFVYSLLPIVRNTVTGLQDIPSPLRESAEALGLEPAAQMRKILLPMASRSILAGIKTSAVINIGTATLAGLIGAGGYGEQIQIGLSLNDTPTILRGAVPSAVMAVVAQAGFDLLERAIIPKGLRLTLAKD